MPPSQGVTASAQAPIPGATTVAPAAAQPSATTAATGTQGQPPVGTEPTRTAGATEAPPAQEAPAAAPVAPTRVVMRELAPNIRFLDAGGQPHTLEEWKGKYVVLLFFSKDCGICATEVPKIQAFTALRSPNGVVLPIESTTGTAEQAAGFASRNGVTVPVYHDPTWEAPRAFMVRKFPQAYVVAPDHTVIEDVAGEASVEFYDIRYRRYFPLVAPALTPGV
jgi:peroxiredoxin